MTPTGPPHRERKRGGQVATAKIGQADHEGAALDDYYNPLTAQANAKQTTSQFNRERVRLAKRRRQAERDQAEASASGPAAMHPDESTFGLITQNVNGFGCASGVPASSSSEAV
jgi:hypothetical protein